MNKNEQKALDDIEQYGCHVLSVMEDGKHPGFCYSIGIQKTLKQPELIIVGLRPGVAHKLINLYYQQLKDGDSYEPGKFYGDFLEGFDVCFVEVDRTRYDDYFGWAKWLYGGTDFKALQLIWPATDGKWPWDDELSEYYIWAQPILSKPD